MRRLALVVTLVCQAALWPHSGRASQTDAVTSLLATLETTLQTGDVTTFIAHTAPSLSAAERDWLTSIASAGSTVVIRERARSATTILAEALVAREHRAFIASWRIDVAPVQSELEVRSIAEVAKFDDIVRLELDASQQLAVRDLTVTGPDFEVRLPSGTVFVAEAGGGPTALVLIGRARVRFAPNDRAEQSQLQIFAGVPALAVDVDELFVRINPRDFATTVSWHSASDVGVDTASLARATRVFESQAGLSYHFDLDHAPAGRWSLEPPPGSLIVDFRTRRHGWLTYSRAAGELEDVSLIDRARSRQISLYRSSDRTTGEPTTGQLDSVYEVRRTELDVTFDPALQWLSGRTSTTIALNRAVTSLSLKLAEALTVSSVSSPELGPLLALRLPGYDSLIVGLPSPVKSGQAFTLDITYSGRLASQSVDGDTLPTPERSMSRPADLQTLVGPRFLYSNRSWWYPQPVTPVYAPAHMRLTIPAAYQAVATGKRVSDRIVEVSDGASDAVSKRRVIEFRADRPVRYLSSLIARLDSIGGARTHVAIADDDSRATDDQGNAAVDIDVMIGPGQSRRTRATPERVASIVEHYVATMGEAPYPAFTAAMIESARPGGHSPAFFALIEQPHAASPLSWSREPVVFPEVPDFFLAHEIAHQWWGQAVGSRTYRDQWITEGFAQYFAWLYVAATDPLAAGRIMARMRSTAEGLVDDGPISLGYRLGHLRGDQRVFQRAVYNKSAVVLHMLRRLIGDEAFFSGVRRLYTENRFGSIDIDDFRSAFQANTSVAMDRFLTRWILEADVPDLQFDWSALSPSRIVVRAVQRGEVFDVPYDVTLHHADGQRRTITLHITDAHVEFPIDVQSPVRRVEFNDPLTLARARR